MGRVLEYSVTQAWRFVWVSNYCFVVTYLGLGVGGRMSMVMYALEVNWNHPSSWDKVNTSTEMKSWSGPHGGQAWTLEVRHTCYHSPEGNVRAAPWRPHKKGSEPIAQTGSHSISIDRVLFHFIYSQNYSPIFPQTEQSKNKQQQWWQSSNWVDRRLWREDSTPEHDP